MDFAEASHQSSRRVLFFEKALNSDNICQNAEEVRPTRISLEELDNSETEDQDRRKNRKLNLKAVLALSVASLVMGAALGIPIYGLVTAPAFQTALYFVPHSAPSTSLLIYYYFANGNSWAGVESALIDFLLNVLVPFVGLGSTWYFISNLVPTLQGLAVVTTATVLAAVRTALIVSFGWWFFIIIGVTIAAAIAGF